MKYGDLNNKSTQELDALLEESRIKLGTLRFELSQQALKDVSQIKKAKQDIARILTARNHRHGK